MSRLVENIIKWGFLLEIEKLDENPYNNNNTVFEITVLGVFNLNRAIENYLPG